METPATAERNVSTSEVSPVPRVLIEASGFLKSTPIVKTLENLQLSRGLVELGGPGKCLTGRLDLRSVLNAKGAG